MNISIKHFLLGALLGLIPVSFYGYVKLNSAKPAPQVLAAHTEFTPSASFMDVNDLISTASADITHAPISVEPPSPTAKPTAKPEPTPNVVTTAVQKSQPPEDLTVLIEKYAKQYGADKDMMIHIAKCESGFRERAVNGPYAGMYQFISSTWNSNRRAMGEDPNPELRFVAEEAIKTAAFKMGRDGYGAWPVCQKK
ncbi:MAG TPA: transglycosylase family protein, partial [Ignavibacteriaceae bacterium]